MEATVQLLTIHAHSSQFSVNAPSRPSRPCASRQRDWVFLPSWRRKLGTCVWGPRLACTALTRGDQAGGWAGWQAGWRTGGLAGGARPPSPKSCARAVLGRGRREREGEAHVNTFLPLRETVVWMNFKKCRSNGQSEGFIKVNPCLHSFSTLGHKTDGKNGSLL